MLKDLQTIQKVVRQAGQSELLPRFNKIGYDIKTDGSIITEADLAVDQFLYQALSNLYPGVDYLSEEMGADKQQKIIDNQQKPFWCVDPLDGSSNFAAGFPVFGICLALIEQGLPKMAVIYDPVRDECFAAIRGQGTWINDQRLQIKDKKIAIQRAIALVDFKRLKDPLRQRLVNAPPYASQRNVGSCALEWAWMSAQRGQLYLHGSQKLWDMASGILIFEEAGGFGETLGGESVFRCDLTPRSVIASPYEDLFSAWCEWLREVGTSTVSSINSITR